ncbi:MAG: hypothetical protein H7Y38_01820 [Armatimonadetes bacterium]|nr:hypothetical protein [Armatimonadota bacterium]
MTRFATHPLPALLALMLGALAFAPNARAVSLFSNFNLPVNPASSTGIGVSTTGTPPNNLTRKGLRFTTGANAYTLTSVFASFALETGTDAATVTAALYPGVGGVGVTALNFPDGMGGRTSVIPAPVATLQGASVTALPGLPETYTFAANGAPVLETNTTYLVIFTAGNVRARWHNPTTNLDPIAQNDSGYIDPQYGLYINGSDTNLGGVNNSITSGQIQINGDLVPVVIPEAGTVGLMASGLAIGLAGVLRRRK